MPEILQSGEEPKEPINPLQPVTEEEAQEIRELVEQTFLPVREISVGEYDPRKTLIPLRPLLEMGYGRYITEEFLGFIGHHSVESYLEEVIEHPDDTLEAALADSRSRLIPEQRRDGLVEKARAVISQVVESERGYFEGKSACGLLWGSMQYGDPSEEPDIDFDFVVDDPEVAKSICRGERIENINQIIADNGYGAHSQIISLVEFNQLLDDLEQGAFVEVRELWDISGILMSGERIAIPGADQEAVNAAIDNAVQRIHRAAEINPLYRYLVCMDLRSIADDWRKMQRPVRRAIEEAKSMHE